MAGRRFFSYLRKRRREAINLKRNRGPRDRCLRRTCHAGGRGAGGGRPTIPCAGCWASARRRHSRRLRRLTPTTPTTTTPTTPTTPTTTTPTTTTPTTTTPTTTTVPPRECMPGVGEVDSRQVGAIRLRGPDGGRPAAISVPPRKESVGALRYCVRGGGRIDVTFSHGRAGTDRRARPGLSLPGSRDRRLHGQAAQGEARRQAGGLRGLPDREGADRIGCRIRDVHRAGQGRPAPRSPRPGPPPEARRPRLSRNLQVRSGFRSPPERLQWRCSSMRPEAR